MTQKEMKQHKTLQRENQDEIDLVIQEFGNVENYFEIKKNESGNDFRKLESVVDNFFQTSLTSGVEKTFVNTEKLGDPTIVNSYKKTNFVVNNAGSMSNPIGIGVWIIESDFVVQ